MGGTADLDPTLCRKLAAQLAWVPGCVNAALQLRAAAAMAEQREREASIVRDGIEQARSERDAAETECDRLRTAIRALATGDVPAGELRRLLLELIGERP